MNKHTTNLDLTVNKILRENGLAYRLVKDGKTWDYSDFVEDLRRWTSKILAEEPEARVEFELTSEAEWYRWRTGEDR